VGHWLSGVDELKSLEGRFLIIFVKMVLFVLSFSIVDKGVMKKLTFPLL
jgi:hypothetical protein